jgi:hypothetical protein
MSLPRSKEAAIEERSRSGQLKAFVEQAIGCGWCSHPVRVKVRKFVTDPDGTTRLVFSSSSLPDGVVLKACRNRRETRCPACASVYKADARHLVRAGLEGGKGVDPSVASHPAVLLTLTAPSFGRVHTERSETPCHPDGANARCEQGNAVACLNSHHLDDEVLGTPICAECYRYEDAVLQNALTPELWRRTSIYIARKLADQLGITQAVAKERYRVSFVRVAELQRRGAVHLHVIVRLDRQDGPAPDVGATVLAHACLSAARSVSVEHPRGNVTWGDESNQPQRTA